jgi:hypothetical protein
MRYVLLLVLLAGCAGRQYTEAEAIQIMARYGPVCELKGYGPNHPLYPDCIKRLYDNDNPSMLDSFSRGLGAAGGALSQPPSEPYRSLDLTCMNNCVPRFSHGYCERVCTY